MAVKTRLLVESATAMVHSTIASYLKKAEMQQLPSLIVAVSREAMGALSGFIEHGLQVSEQDAVILAALMTIHNEREHLGDRIAEDFEKLTGRPAPESVRKFIVVETDGIVDEAVARGRSTENVAKEKPEVPRPAKKAGVH